MSKNFYAGIGSRATPAGVLNIMEAVATALYMNDWWLRSGAADGADKAFESGAGEHKEIFLPWGGFNGSKSVYSRPAELAYNVAKELIPHWDNLSSGAQKLHARNVHQLTGPFLCDPVKFVMCWTENGQIKGGTATAIKLAHELSIPVFNLGKFTTEDHQKFQSITGLKL